ncbi:hypothetical protein DTO021C3_7827 [Paecilomyces variotii]|nr:hypothetical protein DTO195F2_8525 [Paecilomyces variotii]KAJ9284596.1 hypothetical protein DTO021C3_7827 [Paecilomyces variotii]
MEPLSLSTRGLLRRRSLCLSCFRRHLFQSRSFARPSRIAPQYGSSANSGIRSRHFHRNERGPEEEVEEEATRQAFPQGSYYAEMLASPHPSSRRAVTTRKIEPPQKKPTPSSTTEPQSPRDRMAIVFGSRLAGPGRSSRYNPATTPPESTWKTVNGVPIPPRPLEPDNCCMSGCAHCVWDDFRDDMEQWAARVEEAYARAKAKGPEKDLRQMQRPEVRSASVSMDDDGGGSETNWNLPSATDEEELFGGIPVGIREFMRTEKKLREKHKAQQQTA